MKKVDILIFNKYNLQYLSLIKNKIVILVCFFMIFNYSENILLVLVLCYYLLVSTSVMKNVFSKLFFIRNLYFLITKLVSFLLQILKWIRIRPDTVPCDFGSNKRLNVTSMSLISAIYCVYTATSRSRRKSLPSPPPPPRTFHTHTTERSFVSLS